MRMEKDIQNSSRKSDNSELLWRRKIFQGLNSKLLWVMKAYLILAFLELLLFPSFAGAFGLVMSFAGIALTRFSLCRTQKLLHYPLSTLALLFYCLFFNILPLPATLLEFKPLIYNMRNPYTTFFFVLYLQAILCWVHYFYVKLTKNRNIIRDVLKRVNFFQSLTPQEVWFLILGSFIWYAYVMVTRGLYTEDNLNINANFGVAEWAINLFFSGFYQIVFIFYFRKINNIRGRYQIYHALIWIIAVAIFIIGIGTNMRTAAITVFANGAFSLLLYLIYYPSVGREITKPKYVVMSLLLSLFFIGPFQRISKSMVAVRYDRGGKNALELFEMTMKTNVNETNEDDIIVKQTSVLAWNEDYLDSDLLNRFCSLKIQDEALFHAMRLNEAERRIMRVSLWTKLIDQLPKVIKSRLGMRISYEERSYSLSDLMYYLSTGKRSYLGGIKIGSLQGLGMALFGHWFPLVLIPLYFVMFYLMDSIVMFRENRIIFPLLFFAGMMQYLAFFSDRHFYLYELRYIFRGFWETVIAYTLSINVLKRLPFLKH